jgi:alpha-L-fucosidase 2
VRPIDWDARPNVIRLSSPATEWLEGLPIANGVSAAMVWGSPSRLVLSLNHVDFWRHNLVVDGIPDVSAAMATGKALAMKGRYEEADAYLFANVARALPPLMPRQRIDRAALGEGTKGLTNGFTNAFEALGELVVTIDDQEGFGDYSRALDLERGIASVVYGIGDDWVEQEAFVPAKQDAILLRVTSTRPLSGRISFTRPQQAEYAWSTGAIDHGLVIRGAFPEGVTSAIGVRADATASEGLATTSVGSESEPDGPSISFDGATRLEIVIALVSGRDALGVERRWPEILQGVEAVNLDQMREEHVAEHREMFGRAGIEIGPAEAGRGADADELVRRAAAGEYPNELAELTFQLGRYLIMSCNRAGRRPANLQGIWNREPYPIWDSDWHFDLNIQMNHWLCNPTNLDECNQALFRQMDTLVPLGRMLARKLAGSEGILFMGVAGGDQMTAGYDENQMAVWSGAAAWIAQHYWAHYQYTKDRSFLEQEAYPFMREVGLYWKTWLVKDAAGKYVSGISFSPENMTELGLYLVPHCAMDTALVREVMRHLLEAGEILDVDRDLWSVWQDLHDNVLPYSIGDDGELKEWPPPLAERPDHRTIPHLYPVFPGDEFGRERTPELFAAARKALALRDTRRGTFVNWTFSWSACCNARFRDGDSALRDLGDLCGYSAGNLLSYYPDHGWGYDLFQIEANLAATAAITEMLLQSHEGCIDLLPALPGAWATGCFHGLKARGAFVVDAEWRDGRPTRVSILSLKGELCRVRIAPVATQAHVSSDGAAMDHVYDPATRTVGFPTTAGARYELAFG